MIKLNHIKNITIFLLLITIIFSCKNNANELKTESKDNNTPDWLLGSWRRINDGDNGEKTYEIWQKTDIATYSGFGFVLLDKDTVFSENITLQKQNDEWKMNVIMPGEPEPTVFKVTSMKPNEFICENPENEFPVKIRYNFDKDTLKASISGGNDSINFIFVKN